MANPIFKKITEGKVWQGNNWIAHGDYMLVIEKTFLDKKRKGVSFIAEFRVLRSSPLDSKIPRADGVKAPPPNGIGTTIGYVQNLEETGDKGTIAIGNTKALLLAVFSMTEAEMTPQDVEEFPQVLEEACNIGGCNGACPVPCTTDHKGLAVQPLRGRLIACTTIEICTKGKGQWITVPRWTGIEESEEVIAARRALLDKGQKIAA